MSRQALGRGLKALIPQVEEARGEEVKQIAMESIEPNPYQPRITFDEDSLQELAASIEEKGVLQPITVREKGERFELVAGAALETLGWRIEEIPALVKTVRREIMEIALIENTKTGSTSHRRSPGLQCTHAGVWAPRRR